MKLFLSVSIQLFWISFLFSQQSINLSTNSTSSLGEYKEVEILHADKLEFNTLEDGSQIRKLVGDVSLQHESTLFYCDSAVIFKATNEVKAWGNIHIIDNDSIHAYSKSMIYEGKIKKAQLIGDAKIIDNNKTLSSQLLVYDMQNKKGYYTNNGKLEMDSTILVSKKASYHTETKIAEFREKVVITDPNYHLDSDTLHYHTETKVAYFFGPTKIYNDSSTIDCISGSYDTKNEIASFGKGTIIHNEPQVLYADSLYYERFRSYGKAFYFFDWRDIEMEASMVGTRAEYFENHQEIIAYDRPLLKVKQEEDTLFLKGDIIHTKELETHGEKEFWSYGSVRIFKTDLQGIADSLFYSFFDSTMRLFQEPFLWNEANQMQGDTIVILLANDQVQEVQFLENAFVSMQSKGKIFDQIKGKNIFAYFIDNEMKTMLAIKNAESLYFGKNEEQEYLGANYAVADKIRVLMLNKEVDKITFIAKPEALFTPMSQLAESDYYLKGFTWQNTLRPKSKYDL